MSKNRGRVRVKTLTQTGVMLVQANLQVVAVFANGAAAAEAYGLERLESIRLRRELNHVADLLSMILGEGGLDGPVGYWVELVVEGIGRAVEHEQEGTVSNVKLPGLRTD